MCTTLGLTRALIQTNRVSGVDSRSLEGPTLGSFVYLPTCTTLGLNHARNQMNRVSGVDSRSLWGAYPGDLSDTPTHVLSSVSMSHIPETNTRHHANHALSRICETKVITPQGHFVPQLYHKRVWSTSSQVFYGLTTVRKVTTVTTTSLLIQTGSKMSPGPNISCAWTCL